MVNKDENEDVRALVAALKSLIDHAAETCANECAALAEARAALAAVESKQ